MFLVFPFFFLGVAFGHMKMTNPVPFGKSTLNNSPLNLDGGDFPCKQRLGVYDPENVRNSGGQGSTMQLTFLGSAVHGGGSCQVSITRDLQPTKDSVWKVIKSIEGGCPAKGQEGNMGTDSTAENPFKYDFKIPDDLPAGTYTLAWTWFNKVGNREMYMNCAPLTVTGSRGSDSLLESLPDMFVANIGNNCSVPEGKDVMFPNPGTDIDRFSETTSAFVYPSGGGCLTGHKGGNVPTMKQGPTTGGSSITGSPTSTSPVVTTNVHSTVSASPTTDMRVYSSPTTLSTKHSSTAECSSTQGSPEHGFTEHEAGTPCTIEGGWNCLLDKFQRCAAGTWSVVQSLAVGVHCAPGESLDLRLVSFVNTQTLAAMFK